MRTLLAIAITDTAAREKNTGEDVMLENDRVALRHESVIEACDGPTCCGLSPSRLVQVRRSMYHAVFIAKFPCRTLSISL